MCFFIFVCFLKNFCYLRFFAFSSFVCFFMRVTIGRETNQSFRVCKVLLCDTKGRNKSPEFNIEQRSEATRRFLHTFHCLYPTRSQSLQLLGNLAQQAFLFSFPVWRLLSRRHVLKHTHDFSHTFIADLYEYTHASRKPGNRGQKKIPCVQSREFIQEKDLSSTLLQL